MTSEGLGERLFAAREAKGFTQAKLAATAGVSGPSVISNIEQGKVNPNFPTATRLADALGISLDWLAGRGSVAHDPDLARRLKLREQIRELEAQL